MDVASWYGLNGMWDNWRWDLFPFTAFVAASPSPARQHRTLALGDASSQVALFDGYYISEFSPNKISLRHSNLSNANLSFFDGHASTYTEDALPEQFSTLNNDTEYQTYLNESRIAWRIR